MPQWKENKSVICSFFLHAKACIQAWSLTLFTRLRLCQKLKSFSWGPVMISKDSESVCQSYPLHLLWESPFTCFLSSHKDMETPLQRCLTGQGWSLTGLEYMNIRALKDTSTTSHMQALLHLFDSPDSVGFTYKYQSVRGMCPPQTSSHNMGEHSASLDSCYTTQSTQCHYFRNRRGRSWGSSVECSPPQKTRWSISKPCIK